MENLSVILPTTYEFLLAWLRLYVKDHPVGTSICTVTELEHFEQRDIPDENSCRNGHRVAVQVGGDRESLTITEIIILSSKRASKVTISSKQCGFWEYLRQLLLAMAEQWPIIQDLVARHISMRAESATRDKVQCANPSMQPEPPLGESETDEGGITRERGFIGSFRLLQPGTLVRYGVHLRLTEDAWLAALDAFDGTISSENPEWFEALWAAQIARDQALKQATAAGQAGVAKSIADLDSSAHTDDMLPEQRPETKVKHHEPTHTTRVRAEVFKRIKDEHREWGYDTVAMRACEELKADNITGETVRYVYRAMGWPWERADRIR